MLEKPVLNTCWTRTIMKSRRYWYPFIHLQPNVLKPKLMYETRVSVWQLSCTAALAAATEAPARLVCRIHPCQSTVPNVCAGVTFAT